MTSDRPATPDLTAALAGPPSAETSSRVPRTGRVRWAIVVLLFFGILINYFDRTNLSVAEGPLGRAFGLGPGEIGVVLSSFLWTYTLMQIPAGLLLDRIGITWVLRAATWLWAVACLLTAVASGTGLLLVSRLLLGVAEAPVFPGTMKATGYWFPRAERGLSTAVFDSGQRLSNVIGTPLVALAAVQLGWRGAFWATAALSLVFAAVFWVGYRNPAAALSSGRLSRREFDHIRAGGAQDEDHVQRNSLGSLRYVLGRRKVWGLSLGLACAGYTAWLLLTWLPGYLQTSLHMSLLKSGFYTAIPWLVAVVAEFLVPGWLVDELIRRGRRETSVRKGVLVAGMVVAVGIVGAAFTTSVGAALCWITVGTVGITLAYCVSNSLPALIAPEGCVGAVASVMNFVNTLFGLAAPIVTGYLVQVTGSFGPAFVVAGLVMVAGIFCYTVVLGPIEQIPAAPPPVGR